jgi:hypothetical protein
VAVPVGSTEGLTRRQRKIVNKFTEDALAIGLTPIKGALAVEAAGRLEDYANMVGLGTTTRMARRLQAVHQLCPNEDIRAVQVVFTVDSARRLTEASFDIVDSTDGAMLDVVQRPLPLPEAASFLELLFGRRRR